MFRGFICSFVCGHLNYFHFCGTEFAMGIYICVLVSVHVHCFLLCTVSRETHL